MKVCLPAVMPIAYSPGRRTGTVRHAVSSEGGNHEPPRFQVLDRHSGGVYS